MYNCLHYNIELKPCLNSDQTHSSLGNTSTAVLILDAYSLQLL